MTAVLRSLIVDAKTLCTRLDQAGLIGRSHQKRVRTSCARDETLSTGCLAGYELDRGGPIEAVPIFLPGGKNDTSAGQYGLIGRFAHQPHGERPVDQGFRNEAAAKDAGQCTIGIHSQSEAAGRLRQAQHQPAHFSHLLIDVAIKTFICEPQSADTPQPASGGHKSARAITDHFYFQRIGHGSPPNPINL